MSTPKREKRPGRMSWFALDVVSFKDDPRMQRFTAREKSFWLCMMVNSFHTTGMMIADPAVVADLTGATLKEAEALLLKLYSTGLLVATPQGERVFDALSPRMVKEHAIAQASYGRYSKMGSSSAEKNGTANLKLDK